MQLNKSINMYGLGPEISFVQEFLSHRPPGEYTPVSACGSRILHFSGYQ